MGCERRNVGCFQLDRSVDDYSAAVKFRGTNGRRYCHLYIDAVTHRIGTRRDHQARYRCNCLSAKQRKAGKEFRQALKAIRAGIDR
jgi:hypothetical protein